MYHIDEQIQLSQRKNENKKERSYSHNHKKLSSFNWKRSHRFYIFKSEKIGEEGEVKCENEIALANLFCNKNTGLM